MSLGKIRYLVERSTEIWIQRVKYAPAVLLVGGPPFVDPVIPKRPKPPVEVRTG